jgi:sugar O-acyltransferase (sialic acid O-acetyltransferase NeuD family)
MRRLYLCGAGNPEGVRLAIRLNAQARRWDELLLLDDDPARLGQSQMGVPVLGSIDLLANADRATAQAVNLISRSTPRRRAARARIAAFGVPFASLISADVDLLGAEVGQDLIAYQHATIGPEVVIGEGTVVFMSATVGHECRVGDHCVVAPNAVLNARVRLGDGVYVGSNAVVLPEITIGAGAVIGAGGVVVDDVPEGATVVGRPSDVVQATAPSPRRPQAPHELGATLHRLWCEALGLPRLPETRNFFDMGGTSLLALRLAQRIQMETGRDVCAVDLFHHPTLASLEAHLRADPEESAHAVTQGAQLRAELRRSLRHRGD